MCWMIGRRVLVPGKPARAPQTRRPSFDSAKICEDLSVTVLEDRVALDVFVVFWNRAEVSIG